MLVFSVCTSSDNKQFTIDSISSSVLNLGLTQDLIKKHIIDLNILIRNDVFNSINFNEKVDEYEDEAKPVYWVYPNLIYPKDDNMKNMGEIDIHKLISESKRKKFNLVITKIRYNEDNVLAYLFSCGIFRARIILRVEDKVE